MSPMRTINRARLQERRRETPESESPLLPGRHETAGEPMPPRVGVLLLAASLACAMLAACGKKGPPEAPGPPDQITWPRTYPTH
jgi:predicted small lipoprotein YifL